MSGTKSQQLVLRRRWVLVALMVTMILAAMDNTIVATAVPQIVGDLGGFSLFSWLFSIYLLVQTVTIPIYGKLVDIYGRKPIIIIGIVIFLIGSAACALAWDMVSLISFRGVQAVGAGAIMGTVNTIAGDIYSIEERAKIQGWLSSVWGVSAIVGPALGGALATYATWRWIFLVNLPFGVISILLLVLFLHEKELEKKPKVDWLGAGAMLVTGTVIMFGLLQGGDSWPWISYPSFFILMASIVLIYVTFKIEQRANEPILPRWVWSRRELVGSNLGALGMGMILIGPGMYLPVYAQSVHGASAIVAGLVLGAMSLTWPLSSSLSGRYYLTIGFRNCALLGVSLLIVGTFSFLLIPFQGSLWLLVAIQLVLGAGFGLVSTPLLVGVQSTVKWEKRGVVTGTNMFSRYFGESLGAAIIAVVFNNAMFKTLSNTPASVADQIPTIDHVVEAIQSSQSSPILVDYLRQAFFTSTQKVYLGLTVIGVITFIILLLTPAKFTLVDDD